MRALKEVGWAGFSVNDALSPLINMGQQLFEPPDVAGWDLGPGWFSSGGMLARMNFAAQLATNQKFALRDLSRGHGDTQEELLGYMLDRLTPPAYRRRFLRRAPRLRARRRARTGRAATRSSQRRRPASLHLIVGSGDYQFV